MIGFILTNASRSLLEELESDLESPLGPIYLIVGGQLLDVLQIDPRLLGPDNNDDVRVSLRLRDGRQMICLSSAIHGYIHGNPWT